MIYLIYAPSERNLAQKIADVITRTQGYEFKFAPLGLEAESDSWKAEVEKDLEESDLTIVITTDESLKNESVIWRVEKVFQENKLVAPVAWSGFQIPRMTEIDTRLRTLLQYNWFYFGIGERETDDIANLGKYLLVPRRAVCFISYSRKDTNFTIKLAADLREAKLKTWRDTENILAGANWDREIEKAVKECTHLILVASPSSIESENVMDEVSIAMNKGKTVIPVMIETCELPMRIHRAQWVDFRDGYDQGLKKLLEQLGTKKSELA